MSTAPGSAALTRVTVVLPSAGERDRLVARLAQAGYEPREIDAGVLVRDPSGNLLALVA